jgi:lysophospholipase L1-like esterase
MYHYILPLMLCLSFSCQERSTNAMNLTSVPVQTHLTPRAATSAPTKPVSYPGPEIGASWKKDVYVITDSVVLGAKFTIRKNFKALGWKSTVDGRPAMMIKAGISEYVKTHSKLPEIAVVALGYNSLWEKDKKNFEKWAKRFDSEVEAMLTQLSARGAKKVVWVLLREAEEEFVPTKNKTAKSQFNRYAWYFPYVNERLKALREKHPEMALADWPSVSQRTDLTYDFIHLNPKGAQAMTEEIMRVVGIEPPTEEMLQAAKTKKKSK